MTFGHRSSRTALEGTEGRRAGARRWLRIRLAPSFFLFLLLMAAAGRLTEVATLFGVLVLHELAHIAAARRRGMLVSHVELTPIGGVAHIDAPLGIDPAAELAVAAAGPAFSAALAFVGWLALRYNVVEGDWWHLFIWANVTVLGFNAVPVLPLDGGRIYRAFLARRVGLRRATVHAVRLARPLAAALLFVGVAGTAVRPVSVALLPLAVFVYLAARREEADAPFLLIRFLAAKREELGRRGLLPVQAVAISPEATVRSLAERLVPGRYCVFWVVDGDGKVLGVVSEAQVLDCFFSGGVHRRAGALVSRAKPSRDGRG